MFSDDLIQGAARLLDTCRSKKLMLTTAESCTGGLIAALLTEIPGSSDVFERGFMTYSYASKTEVLGVAAELIKTQGAVSEQVAIAMADGARKYARVNLAVGVTGIAGPGGATPNKPVGTVCFAVAAGNVLVAETHHFEGDRAQVRLQSAAHAIAMLQKAASSFSYST